MPRIACVTLGRKLYALLSVRDAGKNYMPRIVCVMRGKTPYMNVSHSVRDAGIKMKVTGSI